MERRPVRGGVALLLHGAGNECFSRFVHATRRLKKGLKKMAAATEAQNFNALEIVEITTKRFLGLCYARVVAHARHAKHSPYLRDLDPHYVPRNVWDFKQVFGGVLRSGRTAKAI